MYILIAAGALLYGVLTLIGLFAVAIWLSDLPGLALVLAACAAAYFSQCGTCTALGEAERGAAERSFWGAAAGLGFMVASIVLGAAAFVRIFFY